MLAFNREKRNIVLFLEFDGSLYHGWQFQPNYKTIEGELKKAIQKVFLDVESIIGVSRTDAGVSAYYYVCNFFTNSDIPIKRVPRALNTYLPNDIVVFAAEEREVSFDSRFSAVSKTYLYSVLNSPYNSAFFHKNLWHIRPKLDIEKMTLESKALIGEHDFSSFCNAGEVRDNKVRNIIDIEIIQDGEMISFLVTGDGFLYNMVRIIVGTLVDIGLGKDYNIENILKEKNRTKAGQTAPPNGLFLHDIDYGTAFEKGGVSM